MSYALGVTLASGEYPQDMYITTDAPIRTMRTAQYDGKPILIFGGESHAIDEDDGEMDDHYRALITDVHKQFDVEEVKFRWLAGDFMPYDRMPYIGRMPKQNSVHVITGYRAWGLAWALSAAEAITGDITGNPQAWAKHFSTDRLSDPIPEEERIKGV